MKYGARRSAFAAVWGRGGRLLLPLLLLTALSGCQNLTVRDALNDGRDALQKKQPEQARKAFMKAVEESGGDPNVLMQIGAYYYMAGRPEDAKAWLARASEKDLSPQQRNQLAMLHIQIKETDRACAELQRAAAEAPKDGMVQNNYAYTCLVEPGKDLDRAIALLTDALKTAGRQAAIVDSLGWAYYQRYEQVKNPDDLQQAIELLQEAVEKEPGRAGREVDPGAAALRYHLGRAYMAAGDWDSAYVELMKASSLDPALGDAKTALEEVQRHRLPAKRGSS
jgi:Tfp pilus assembly protein PilF